MKGDEGMSPGPDGDEIIRAPQVSENLADSVGRDALTKKGVEPAPAEAGAQPLRQEPGFPLARE